MVCHADTRAALGRTGVKSQFLPFIGDKDRYEDLMHLSSEVAMTIGKFRVLNLEELIRQKKATDRPKDRAVIELLEEALRHHKQKD